MDSRQRSIVAIYGAVILICALAVITGNFIGPYAGTKLSDVGAEGFKISIAALVGALSTLLGGGRAT